MINADQCWSMPYQISDIDPTCTSLKINANQWRSVFINRHFFSMSWKRKIMTFIYIARVFYMSHICSCFLHVALILAHAWHSIPDVSCQQITLYWEKVGTYAAQISNPTVHLLALDGSYPWISGVILMLLQCWQQICVQRPFCYTFIFLHWMTSVWPSVVLSALTPRHFVSR